MDSLAIHFAPVIMEFNCTGQAYQYAHLDGLLLWVKLRNREDCEHVVELTKASDVAGLRSVDRCRFCMY